MNKTRLALNVLTTCILLLAGNSLAHAQSTRTWVSGTGADANPCSRTAPCQTFAGAFSKTAINGEINVLDPGAYGTLTVSKSISINADGNFAGVLASATTGFIINLTTAVASDPVSSVRLRGIDINGSGSCGAGCGTRTGIRGINVSSANTRPVTVVVENTQIDGFVNEGILFAANGGDLVVNNTEIRNNAGAGIKVDSSGANINHANINNSRLVLNGDGIRVEDNVRATVSDSIVSNNTANGAVAANLGTPSVLQLERTVVASNRTVGVLASGTANFGTVTLSECMVVHNGTGLQSNAGGQIRSFGHNRVVFNITADGAFTPPIIAEQ
ncbi:MAG TPA: hypothetical protein VF553_22570 [Pyrinomonadaceae bacterium]|jgi:uncharacterized protein YaiE (UPF0345 family)